MLLYKVGIVDRACGHVKRLSLIYSAFYKITTALQIQDVVIVRNLTEGYV
jgi:hypothetical protein